MMEETVIQLEPATESSKRPLSILLVDDDRTLTVAGANTAHKPYIVHQQRACIMQPVFRSDLVREQPTADDLLAGNRHHERVLDIMIKRRRVADPLQDEPCCSTQI